MNVPPTYTRRDFLKQSARATSTFLLLSSVPSFLKSRQLPGFPVYLERAWYTMGTTVTISAYGEDRRHLNQAMTRAFEEIQQIDDLMSLYKPRSQLSTLNRLAGKETVRVDTRLLEILEHAVRFHNLTNGAFDITIEPLMELWGFRNGSTGLSAIPSDAEIQQRLDAIGIHNIVVNQKEQTVGLLNPSSKIDLGGIAVGYSVDRAVHVLRSEGIENAFINHSGDAYGLRCPTDADGWEIGIPNPCDPREIVSSFTLQDKAVSTSGNYEKFVEIDGHRFGHILNPRLGKPSETMLSATFFARTALEADALSTGLFSMGPSQARSVVGSVPGAELLMISNEGEQVDVKSVEE